MVFYALRRRWGIIRICYSAVRARACDWRTAVRFYRLCDFKPPTKADMDWLATLSSRDGSPQP